MRWSEGHIKQRVKNIQCMKVYKNQTDTSVHLYNKTESLKLYLLRFNNIEVAEHLIEHTLKSPSCVYRFVVFYLINTFDINDIYFKLVFNHFLIKVCL